VTTQEDLAELQLNLKIAFDHFRRAFKEELCGAALPGMNSAVARAEGLEKPQERTLDAKLADASSAAKRSFYSPHSALTATLPPLFLSAITNRQHGSQPFHL
jgi:hypothetical protein